MSAVTDMVGKVLDEKYRLDKKLGQGGMGAVFKATHLGTTRPVAVKVITPQFMDNAVFIERFKREAEAAGCLRHPNVVNVTDFGFAKVGAEQIAYLVMEFLEGTNLGDMLKKRKRLPLGFIVDIVEQTCLAVEAAHQRGIIHRDLKPDNIWLEPTGRGGYNVKVLDFGLAKLKHLDSSKSPDVEKRAATSKLPSENETLAIEPHVTKHTKKTNTLEIKPAQTEQMVRVGEELQNSEGLTQAGSVLGTPIYMSPEQCSGDDLDARCDIYSIGVLTYQMIAGETPFTGSSYQLMLKHIQEAPPPLKDKRKNIPNAVTNIVMSALAKNREERPVSATAFASALRANVEGERRVLHQAFELYADNFRSFFRISLRIYIPFILINYILIFSLVSLTFRPGDPALKKIYFISYCLLSLCVVLVTNAFSTASFSLIVEQLRIAPMSHLQLAPIFSALFKRLGALIKTVTIGYLTAFLHLFKLIIPGIRVYSDIVFLAPVIMIEQLSGKKAIERSEQLADRLRSVALPIQLRDLLIGIVTLTLFPSLFVISGLFVDAFTPAEGSRIPIRILFALIPITYVIISHPPIAIALSMVYFKSREAGGEKLKEDLTQELEEEENVNLIPYQRITVLCSLFLLSILCWFLVRNELLSWTAENNYYYTSRALIVAGANVNTVDPPHNLTPLMYAAKNNNIKDLELFLSAGADRNINAKDNKGWTALMYAADLGHIDIVKALIAAGADVKVQHNYGSTSLMRAARHGHNDVVKALIAAGADINTKNNYGLTPLMEAAGSGHSETVKILCAAGANKDIENNNGLTALKLAAKKGHSRVVEVLKEAGVKDQGVKVEEERDPEENDSDDEE